MNEATGINLDNTERWQSLDEHHLHPFTNPKDLQNKPPRIIESAEGVYLTDSDGKELNYHLNDWARVSWQWEKRFRLDVHVGAPDSVVTGRTSPV